MAKLHSYFVLCPLLDRKSFLGVAPGKNDGEVLITLGRNVVNKYRLTDQKQTGGWTSKDHITAAVVYDQDQDEYVGVFNNNIIKTWKDETDNLEKLKKNKFATQILKVIKLNKSSLIVFANGTCASLQYAIDNRKASEEKSLLKNGDVIHDVATYNHQGVDYICYIIENNKKIMEIVVSVLQTELGDIIRSKIQKHKIVRDDADVKVIGKVITVADPPTVFVLWSDAKVNSFDLIKSKWKLCGTVPWISTKSNFSMEWMGDKHLILFGSDTEQDGAILVAFNVVLGVGSCRYPMKIYCENAKLYCLNERLILEAGNHLGMLPYALETSRSLASLIGTHEIRHDEYTELADWGVGETLECETDAELQELVKRGLSEQSIVQQLIPPLIVKGDSLQVVRMTKQFNNIPEDIIVKMTLLAIKQFDYTDSIFSDETEFQKMYDKKSNECNFLNYIFSLPFSDAVLIPQLRNGISLKDALFLLMYIGHFLEGDNDFGLDYEGKLVDWCALLMDAFYQQYLISSDKIVDTTLSYTKTVISKLIQYLDKFSDLLSLLNGLLSKHKKPNNAKETSLYSIELMTL